MKVSTSALIMMLAAGGAGTMVSAQQVRYDGHRSVRVTVSTARELMTVRSLADDILTCEGSGIGKFDVRVSPARYAALVEAGIRHEVLIPDIQAHMDQIWADDARIRAGDDPSWFTTYRSLAEINARMNALAAQFPQLATTSNIGTSVLNVPIRMIRITGPGSTTNRPAFVIQACQHAREWVSPMSAMYIVDRFLETYATDTRIKAIVDSLDFYIIPVVNVDGYEYSRTVNNQWRKNRREQGSCDGIDLNRNWGFQWGFDNVGSSGNMCSDTYRGPAAWSEPEIAGIKSLVDSLAAQNRLEVHWDIHANAQMILSPWGYTTAAPPHLPLMDQLGLIIHNGMLSVRGTDYEYGEGSVILYTNNGNTRDYSYGVHGAMAWTIEMTGSSFQPAVNQILPIAQEALAGLLPLAEYYIPPAPPTCYANCDASSGAPLLTANDFSCFLNAYANNQSYANCDGAGGLTANDFQCFLNSYANGCS
jgi:hypothetical protein